VISLNPSKSKTVLKNIVQLLPEPAQRSIKKIHYARKLRAALPEEELDLKGVSDLVGQGDRVIDIGANFGLYTRFLSEMTGPSGEVFSVEPIPETFEILRSNVRRLKLTNVRIKNIAFSNRPGSLSMEIPTYEEGGDNFYQARIVKAGNRTSFRRLSVRTATLDSLFFGGKPISFVKCDVEGHELEVVQGAQKTIRAFHPAWLIEISGNPDSDRSAARETFNLLEEHRYHPYIFDGEKFRHRRKGDSVVNYFFLTHRHSLALIEKGLLRPSKGRP